MKQFFLCTFITFFAINTFGQQSQTPSPEPNVDFLKVSKNKKAAGWLLTGVGTAGLMVTLAADAGQVVGNGMVTIFSLGTVKPEYKSYTGAYLLSAAAIGGGVMYFIASSKNSKRAKAKNASVFITVEKAPQLNQTQFQNTSFPAVGTKISF